MLLVHDRRASGMAAERNGAGLMGIGSGVEVSAWLKIDEGATIDYFVCGEEVEFSVGGRNGFVLVTTEGGLRTLVDRAREALREVQSAAFVPRLDKKGPAVWAGLDGKNRAAFEAEFRAVLTEVAETFDVDRLTEVVRRWWPRAVLDAHPDPIAEHIAHRLSDGDQSVLTKTATELRAEMIRQMVQ